MIKEKDEMVKREELVAHITKEIKDGISKCGYCEATKRADILSNPEHDEDGSITVILECRACNHQDVRHYPK